MADGNHRFDAVLMALIKEIVVKLDTRRVGGGLVSLGEDPAPCDRGAEALEPHLGKQFDILFVAVIKINGHMAGVILSCQDTIRKPTLGVGVACGKNIRHAQALAVLVVSTLTLVGGYRAAPQEIAV